MKAYRSLTLPWLLGLGLGMSSCHSDGNTDDSGAAQGGASSNSWNEPEGGSVNRAGATTAVTVVSGTSAGGSSGGAATGGSSGSTGDCVNVCELYGPVCCVTDLGCVKPGASCVVDILEGTAIAYEYSKLEEKIAALPQNVRFSFTDKDIAWAAAHPELGAHFEFHMTPEWSLLHDKDITEYMDGTPFRLSCNGQSLFVGVFYLIYGAAALDTPVLHPARDKDNAVILRLGAWQGAWASYAAGGQPSEKERIDRPELRSVLCQRGALRVLDPSDVSLRD